MSQFQSYRVVHKIHLGGLDSVLDLNSIVLFNGTTLKTEDGEEIKLSQPTAIAGAIKVGWLVPVSSKETAFTPKAAGVQVHSAKSSGEKRDQVNLMTVHDEEQNVGNRKDIRRNNASGNSPPGSFSPNGGEGVVVSRLKTSAKAPPIEIGTNDREVMARLESQSLPVERVRVAKYTGDVSETMVGDDLEDILPDAASSHKPNSAVFTDDGIKTGSGGSRVGGQEDGVVIGKVGAPRTAISQPVIQDDEEESLLPEDNGFREKALRRWAQTGKTWNGQPVSLRDLSLMALSVLEALENSRKEKPVLETPKKVEEKVVSSEGFSWDMSPHWKTRQVAAMRYKENPDILREIYKMENSGGVKKMIESLMEKMGEALTS